MDTMCPTCGEEHQGCFAGLLVGMYLMALDKAYSYLGPEGRDLLFMVASAGDVIGTGDAFLEAEGIKDLSDKEYQVFRDFVARVTLLEEMDRQLGIERAPIDPIW